VPCTAPGGAVPPAADVIDSNGEVDANGADRLPHSGARRVATVVVGS
jgi:hypothetical protein